MQSLDEDDLMKLADEILAKKGKGKEGQKYSLSIYAKKIDGETNILQSFMARMRKLSWRKDLSLLLITRILPVIMQRLLLVW